MTDYTSLTEDLRTVSDGVGYRVTLLSNAAALIYSSLENINWAGFYLNRDGKLVLGPFQGKIACTEIAYGEGVCGTAFQENRTLNIPDVHVFSGHIACDSASNSEIVIPIRMPSGIYGVLDIDSPLYARFWEEDRKGLEEIARTLGELLSAAR